MDWKKLTLSQIRRLVAAIEQASDGRDVVPAIIERAADEPMPHNRVTLEMLINLLEQLGGCTVLSEEVLAAIKEIELLNSAQTIAANNDEHSLDTSFAVSVDGGSTADVLMYAGHYQIFAEHRALLCEHLAEEGSAVREEMALLSFSTATGSGWAKLVAADSYPEWRVATARELLAFGITFPLQQTRYLIVALGTEINLDGSRTVLLLERSDNKAARLVRWDGNWSKECRFLMVKKTATQPINEANFDSLVAACQFVSVNMDFTSRHFPLVDDGTTGKIDEMLLRGMSIDEAVVEIKRRGYVPVGVHRGLKYIRANRQALQTEPRRIVIAAGDRWLGHSPVFTIQGALVMHVTTETYTGGCCYLVARPA